LPLIGHSSFRRRHWTGLFTECRIKRHAFRKKQLPGSKPSDAARQIAGKHYMKKILAKAVRKATFTADERI